MHSPVSDASPLIYLARADRLSLARVIAPVILVPHAVAEEIEAKGEDDVAAQALKTTRWLEIVEPLLVEHGMYLSAHVIEGALALVGE